MKKIIFLLSVFLISCSADEKVVENAEIIIEIETDMTKLLSIDDLDYKVDYEIISLDSKNDESLLGEINKIIAFEQFLYIQQGNTPSGVFIFTRDGEFVKKLAVGRGYGEFFAVRDMLIDKETRQLEVVDPMNCAVLCYDLQGNFKYKTDLPRLNFYEVQKLKNDEYILFDQNHKFKIEKDYYFTFVKNGDVIKESIEKRKGLDNLLGGRHFLEYKNEVYCNSFFGNIMYKIDTTSRSLYPYIKINPILEATDEKLADLTSEGEDFISFNHFRIFDNENLLAFTITKGKNNRFNLLYDIKKQKTYNKIYSDAPYLSLNSGYDDNGEYYYVFPSAIAELKDYTPKSSVEAEILNKLISMTTDSNYYGNPYILYTSYKKK